MNPPDEPIHQDSPRAFSIVADGLTRVFDKRMVVKGIDLNVREGEFFGFLGPNGAGKTTTIRMLTGLLRPTRGRVRIAGYDITAQPLEAKRRMGVLPEETNLYERLTGYEFLEFAGRMYGLSGDQASDRAVELLDLLELGGHGDKMVVDYSHGMKKKVALAGALIHDPRVLFLDEPFEGIDAVSGRAIRDVLRRLTARGVTIFFSSHIMEVVERLCTEVAVISDGQIVGQGSLAELRERAPEQISLEDIFLRLVGAAEEKEGLSWLQ